jgi:RNA polymerase sigma-70 factor (ECF subfamily)
MENVDPNARDRADMERLIAGHDAALNDLMDRHSTPVFHFLCGLVGNEEDANDLAQETFVRVFRARASFRLNDKFSTWLFTIATNLARNHFRWRARHPSVSLEATADESEQALANVLPAPEPSPGEATFFSERATLVRSEVSRLPHDLREVIVLCELEDRSLAEAAAILETTPKAVESRLYRARKILRERLTDRL